MQDKHVHSFRLPGSFTGIRPVWGSRVSRRVALLGLLMTMGVLAMARCAPAQAAEVGCPNKTFTGFSPTLPDCRAYELVSNPIDETYIPGDGEGTGGERFGTGEFIGSDGGFRATASGEAIAYVGGESVSGEGGNGFTSDGLGNQYLAQRGPEGWEASNISLSVNALLGQFAFTAFSADLSVQAAYIGTPSGEALATEPAEIPECASNAVATAYSHTASGYHALITANTPGSDECFAMPVDISANDSHILLEARGAYTRGAVESPVEWEANLYDSVEGSLYQVNIMPNGEPEQQPHAAFGANENRDGAVSPDGSRIFWTALEGERFVPKPKALYVRLNDDRPQSPVLADKCTVPGDACTVQLDAVQGGSGASGNGYFWAASEDGSKVFFTDCNRLTRDSTADASNGCAPLRSGNNPLIFRGSDLYEYDLGKPENERLTDLTVDHNPADLEGAAVQGVVGISGDGSSVYFIADGVLTGSNGEGNSPVAGQPNLYLIRRGLTSFVATLAAGDDAIRSATNVPVGDWQVDPGDRTAEVIASGSAIAFESTLELTGYDNDGVIDPRGDRAHIPELFVYKADSGRIVCVSCNQAGTPPSPERVTEATAAQGLMVGTSMGRSGSSVFTSRWIVEREGLQIYFMTLEPLVATDNNGLQDVYEWRSEGSGGCHEALGCLSLISTAESSSNAYFVDASADGSDVFFTTRSQLAAGGGGETLKLYDARVDGGRAEPVQACTGAGCQGVPPAPPVFATPSSVTFNGTGNYGPPPPPVAKKAKSKSKPTKCKSAKHGHSRNARQCSKKKKTKAKTHSASRHRSQK